MFYNQQRRDDRLAGSDGMEKMRGKENIEEATIRSHMARDVIKQVRTVPEPYQTVFLLRIILEYDYKKIGECYGNSDVWARVVFYRAKNMLQKKSKEELHYEV